MSILYNKETYKHLQLNIRSSSIVWA